MINPVVIKGNKYGITFVMEEDASFDEIKQSVIDKIKESADLFSEGNVAVSFQGKKLTTDQEKELIDAITENSDINILCIVDNDNTSKNTSKRIIENAIEDLSSTNAQIIKGTIRSGSNPVFKKSVIVLGDVNPGGQITSDGNVIILGSLKGTVTAGACGNDDAFVVALEMAPIMIQIGSVIARSTDAGTRIKPLSQSPMIAYVEDNNIYIEKYTKEVLEEIKL